LDRRLGLSAGAVGALALVVALGACASMGAPSNEPPSSAGQSAGPFYPYVGVTNGTNIPLNARVNAGTPAPVAAGAQLELLVPELPAPPWHIEVLSPSGRVLVVLDVPAADVWRAPPTGEGQEIRGDAAMALLSCGRVDVFYGPPPIGPAGGGPAGSPGDCD
jgi:hypothetical protein